MLHKGWMLSRGRRVITDLLYFPSGRYMGPFNLFSIGITAFTLWQNMLHYATSLMLLLQSPWERVLLIQQIELYTLLNISD